MKKTTLTEKKAENTPNGGVLVGKRKGQTIIHDEGTLSGYLVGKTHAEGGIKAVNKSTGQPLEMQGGEVVITAPAVADQTKNEFNGEMLTNRQILSKINERGGGVSFADGGDIPAIKYNGTSYSYGGKTMTDHEILEMINKGGHLSKGKSLPQIAKMHDVSMEHIMKQVKMGLKAESEHTGNKKEQMKIVKDHLVENPNYYTLLKKVGLKKGGQVKENLVKDSKKGDHPARDLNNYNDLMDVQADGEVGADNGINMDGVGGADASGGVGAFEDGGDLDFLNDVERVFDEGGSTDKPIVSYFKVANAGSSLYKMIGSKFNSYYEFVEAVEKAYREIGTKPRSWLSFDVYDENDKFLMKLSSYISDQKNTVKNFNPFTGNSSNLKKVFTSEYPRTYAKYDFEEWFKYKKSSSPKTEPKQSSSSQTESRESSDAKIDMFNQINGILEKENIKLSDVKTHSFFKTTKTKDFDIVNTSTGDVFLLRVFDGTLGVVNEDENKNKSRGLLNDFLKFKNSNPSKTNGQSGSSEAKDESNSRPQVKYLVDRKNDANIENIQGLKNYIEKLFVKGATRVGLEILTYPPSSSEASLFYIYFSSNTEPSDDRHFNVLDGLDALKYAIMGTNSNINYNWDEFFKEESKEEPQQEEQPIRNFELEKKYLTQRINDLSSELDLKRPILSNDEIAFYQREINKFVSKLRKVSNDEMELKPLQARINGVYKVKWGDYEKQYPECDLKSINGIKSELTFEEYMTVRTPEFMSFFGNWEQAYLDNTYSGISKIINPKTKEPMPVFHGTNVLFTEWKTYETNNAHYFAVKREMSDFFASSWESRTDKAGVDSRAIKALNPNTGKFLYRCFLDIRNPIDFSKFGVEKRPIKEFLLFLKINYNIGDYDFWTNLGKASGFTNETRVYAWQIIRLWQNFTKYVKTFTTYDGYIFYEYIPDTPYGGLDNASLSFCAFESNQIKFADAYEFNALSNDSRFDFGGKL